MNLLDAEQTPRVMSRRVLQGLSRFPPWCCSGATASASTVSEAPPRGAGRLLFAYLNLGSHIRIVRQEDEPKPLMIKRLKVTVSGRRHPQHALRPLQAGDGDPPRA
jgi:hypothetical protein